MALPKGRAAFKKKDGILAITDDQAAITWTPLPGTGQPTVSLSIANITSEPSFVPSTHLVLLRTVPANLRHQICNRPQTRTPRSC